MQAAAPILLHTLTLTPTSVTGSQPASGGQVSGTYTVTAGGGASGWEVVTSSRPNWITVSPTNASGTSVTPITLTLDPNEGVARTGTITFTTRGNGAPQTSSYTLMQVAAPIMLHTLTLAPVSVTGSQPASGGEVSGTYTVTAGGDASGWELDSKSNWITVSPASATNTSSTPITLRLNPNRGRARTGTITFKTTGMGTPETASYTLMQAASPAHTLTLDPVSITGSQPASGGELSGTYTVTAGGAASGWELVTSSKPDWITVSPTSATGTSVTPITLRLDPNEGEAPRTGRITFRTNGVGVSQGTSYTVMQASVSSMVLFVPGAHLNEEVIVVNPATQGRLRIHHVEQGTTLTLRDLTSREVATYKELPEGDHTLPLGRVSPGIYLLMIETATGKRLTKRLMIK